MIALGIVLLALTAGIPLVWFLARRYVRWRHRGLADIAVSAIYFALIFASAALFHGVLT